MAIKIVRNFMTLNSNSFQLLISSLLVKLLLSRKTYFKYNHMSWSSMHHSQWKQGENVACVHRNTLAQIGKVNNCWVLLNNPHVSEVHTMKSHFPAGDKVILLCLYLYSQNPVAIDSPRETLLYLFSFFFAFVTEISQIVCNFI